MNDLTIVIGHTEHDEAEQAYAVSQVFRYDLVGNVKDFVKYLEAYEGVIEGGQLVNLKE